MTLIVSPMRHVERLIAARRPSHIVTLVDPEWRIETHAGFVPDRHLKLNLHDIQVSRPGLQGPDRTMVQRLLDFGETWDESAPMLIHCQAGISRSTASAFVLACARSPSGAEAAIARQMRAASPFARPNRLIVSLADRVLKRRGRMLAAIEAMGVAVQAEESQPFDMPARHWGEAPR